MVKHVAKIDLRVVKFEKKYMEKNLDVNLPKSSPKMSQHVLFIVGGQKVSFSRVSMLAASSSRCDEILRVVNCLLMLIDDVYFMCFSS